MFTNKDYLFFYLLSSVLLLFSCKRQFNEVKSDFVEQTDSIVIRCKRFEPDVEGKDVYDTFTIKEKEELREFTQLFNNNITYRNEVIMSRDKSIHFYSADKIFAKGLYSLRLMQISVGGEEGFSFVGRISEELDSFLKKYELQIREVSE